MKMICQQNLRIFQPFEVDLFVSDDLAASFNYAINWLIVEILEI